MSMLTSGKFSLEGLDRLMKRSKKRKLAKQSKLALQLNRLNQDESSDFRSVLEQEVQEKVQ